MPTPRITWLAATAGSYPIANYQVYASYNGGASTLIATTPTLYYDDVNAPANSLCSYEVRTVDSNGDLSSFAGPVSINTTTLRITTTSLPAGSVGVAYTATLAATGGTPPYVTWALISGTLPAGLTLNASTGVISGTPTTAVASSVLAFEVTDTAGDTSAPVTVSLSVTAGPVITTTSLPQGEVGATYSATLAATGGTTPYTWALTGGALPAGLSLNTSTGAITGTPTATGPASATFQVTDSSTPTPFSASRTFTFAIVAGPTITTTALPNVTSGVAYNFSLAETGGNSPFTWAITAGTLPTGLSLNATTGAITGTTTVDGTTSLTFKVTDSPGNASPTVTLSLTVDAAITGSLAYPLLGGTFVATGSVQTLAGQASWQQQVAKLDLAVIGLYPGWSSGGFNLASLATALKGYNSNLVAMLYTIMCEFEPNSDESTSPYYPVWQAVSANNWFLRVTWPSGAIVDGGEGDAINTSTYTTVVSGKNYLQWRATWSAANEFASGWDGLHIDNFNQTALVAGDYTQSGTEQSISVATPTFQAGYAAYVPLLLTALGAGKQVWGNLANWRSPIPSSYNQLLTGGDMEGIIGDSWSIETTGWTAMMAYYQSIMAAMSGGKYVIFSVDGDASTDYQLMRYGLCSCLLGNAYFYYNVNEDYHTVYWFDEYNFDLGTASTSAFPAKYWNQGPIGVYRRDFANGIAICNPKGNGVQTVTLGGTFYRLTGSQDPTVNSGAAVTSVTLQDRDGLILSRTPT